MNNLKLIHHENYLLLVDESKRPQCNDWHYSRLSETIGQTAPNGVNNVNCDTIVAHLPKAAAPLLEGVMLMVDLPTQIDYSWITEVEKVTGLKYDTESQFDRGVEVGYKIAAASKQYTEDDIDAAFLAGSNHQNEVEELRFQAEDFNTALNRFKDSLSPVPVLPVDYQIDTHEICPEVLCQIKGRCNDENKCQKRMIYTTIPNEQGVEVLQGKWIY